MPKNKTEQSSAKDENNTYSKAERKSDNSPNFQSEEFDKLESNSQTKSQQNKIVSNANKEKILPVKVTNSKQNVSGMILPIAPSKRQFANFELSKQTIQESSYNLNSLPITISPTSNVHPDILKLDRNYQKSISLVTKPQISQKDLMKFDNKSVQDYHKSSKSIDENPQTFFPEEEKGLVFGSDPKIKRSSKIDLSSKSLIERNGSDLSNNSIEKISIIPSVQNGGDSEGNQIILIKNFQDTGSIHDKLNINQKEGSLMKKKEGSIARNSYDTISNAKLIMSNLKSHISQQRNKIKNLKKKAMFLYKKLFAQGLSILIIFEKKKIKSYNRILMRKLNQLLK